MYYVEKIPPIIRLTFPGAPIAAKRARIAHYPEHTRMYDPLAKEKGDKPDQEMSRHQSGLLIRRLKANKLTLAYLCPLQ